MTNASHRSASARSVKLDTPIQYLKGVGPKLAKVLKKLGIVTIEDLIFYFPRDYEDRSKLTPLGKLQAGQSVVVKGEIAAIEAQMTKGRFSVLKLILTDRSGSVEAVWFNQPYLAGYFRKGMKLIATGKIELSNYSGVNQLLVKDFEIDNGNLPKIVPLYPMTEGLYPKKIRSMITLALTDHLAEVKEYLPDAIISGHKLWPLVQAIPTLHFPEKLTDVEPARHRLVFDDFFVFQLGLALQRQKVKTETGIPLKVDRPALTAFIDKLPFKLTAAQTKVIEEILTDLQAPHPMNRLLQGDVGSGKTIVATIAALAAIGDGHQVALMAPTEILAQQHYAKIRKIIQGLGVRVKLLTGTAQSKKTVTALDKWDLVIGTHALLEEKITFQKLGLVIIDEQHRFGVKQRENLFKKGANPHLLVMTATPIPRSLALTLYGDMNRSIIDELPPGRTPIKTHYVTASKRAGAYQFIRKQIKAGRQVYVVCPLVAESEELDLKAATEEAKVLQKSVFPEFKVGLLHGRMKPEEKEQVMKAFQDHQLDILVSTTVIEVGIDIPNATVMMVEHAERFGLSQLHQLRGRIGRGSEQSYCFLMAEPKSAEARARIKALLDSGDGFYIAEVDLKLRGPGEFYGTRQSGLPNFRVADIIRDEKILREARRAAFEFVEMDGLSARNIWDSQKQKVEGAAGSAPLN